MKFVFTTLDVITAVAELRKCVVGSRVNNVYDLNSKTYLLKLTRNDEKFVILLESGARIHLTEFEWTKNVMPSGFSMKLRKHIKNKKLSDVKQLGMDRIVDFQFGFDEHMFHLIIELYDRGNMCLTDHSYTILHLLRPRTDANQDVRYAAHEKYPLDLVRPVPDYLQNFTNGVSIDAVYEYVVSLIDATKGPWNPRCTDQTVRPVQKVLASEFGYGQPCVEHCCRLAHQAVQSKLKSSNSENTQLSDYDDDDRIKHIKEEYAKHFAMALKNLLLQACRIETEDAESEAARGFVFGKRNQPQDEELSHQEDFQPFLFDQFRNKPHVAFPTFSKAVDAYFSRIERDKTTEFLAQNEKKADKKFENIKKDHELRLAALQIEQELDIRKAQLLESNRQLVDSIILMVNHALSNQLDWGQLDSMVKEAQARGDPLANHIAQLNLQHNQITVRLRDPFESEPDENDERENEEPIEVVISLDLNALNNARKYYDRKRAAVKKEEKTLVASRKALKSAAFKAQQTRKDLKTVAQITKIRKPMWFEKFFWFISSENYLVVAGRDSQQNEALVKRYLGPDDIYVHADVHGASSVIVKARPLTTEESPVDSGSSRLPLPPPKTLIEAGTMAIVLSSAWNARVVTSAWWVRQDQVSKTAPSGEYLTTGAFMIRGRKNYLPPCHFMYGFGVLFKLDDESVELHRGERRIARVDVPDDYSAPSQTTTVDSQVPAEAGETAESDTEFPDTQLRLNLLKSAETAPLTADSQASHFTITCSRGKGASTRTVGSKKDKALAEKSNKAPGSNQVNSTAPSEKSNSGPVKRGQKSKLRKIKQKYGAQDEDERIARMKLLQGENAKLSQHHQRLMPSSIHEPDVTPAKEDNDNSEKLSADEEDDEQDDTELEKDVNEPLPQTGDIVDEDEHPTTTNYPDSDKEDEQEDRQAMEDDWLRLMDTLTGQPREGDVLLYALPVCAPYSALQNYKYKLKLTPGTAKRGKAAKTALNCFLTDKSSTAREKELMRVMKGEDISRNFPGNVKITFPQIGGNRQK